MKRMRYGMVVAFGAAVVLYGPPMTTVHLTAADIVKLSGCLIRGEGDGAGYLLVNVAGEPGLSSANESAAPGTTGTSGMFANVFYWLDNDDDLKRHIGHRVEIEGERTGDVKDGELKIDRKDLWTEIDVKSDGRQMKAQVPNASLVAGRNTDRKFDVLVRRVEVEKVRMVDAVCR
jgi:hypothetical protein